MFIMDEFRRKSTVVLPIPSSQSTELTCNVPCVTCISTMLVWCPIFRCNTKNFVVKSDFQFVFSVPNPHGLSIKMIMTIMNVSGQEVFKNIMIIAKSFTVKHFSVKIVLTYWKPCLLMNLVSDLDLATTRFIVSLFCNTYFRPSLCQRSSKSVKESSTRWRTWYHVFPLPKSI